jgi:hypothetical protein
MKKNRLFVVGMSVVLLTFGVSVSGCATNVATVKATNFENKPIGLVASPNYTVLGPVSLERNWFGVLGFSTPKMGPISGGDYYFYQSGGILYVELLAAAQEQYPAADAVIDINNDHTGSHYGIFYAKRRNILSGIAIKYSREEIKAPGNVKGNISLNF